MPPSEFDLIRRWTRRLPRGAGVHVGPGDDCAVLVGDIERDRLVTSDLLVEGRHFLRDGLDPVALGWKALAVSVSDVCAMGGRAEHAVISTALPDGLVGAFADGLVEGIAACADRYGVGIVGGDLTGTPGPVVVDVTVLGSVPRGRAVLRSGARPGDELLVSGALGGSLLGRHLHPVPRQDVAARVVQPGMASSMIDLSDGLSSDLLHLLRASGVGAVVRAGAIPVHEDAVTAARDSGRTPLDHALHDGEDYELLLTASPEAADELLRAAPELGLRRIGRVTRDLDVVLVRDDGTSHPWVRRGHDHFA